MDKIQNKIGTCALCGQKNQELEESHIIPKFVIRFFKKNTVGNLRNTENPNTIIQDGEKHYLLCSDCEKRFNVAETLFASKVFRPYLMSNEIQFDYDSWMNYFITSLSWRNLYLDITNFVAEGEIRTEDLDVFISSAIIMQDYLMGRRSDLAHIENHLFFFGDIKSVTEEFLEHNPHMCIQCSLGGYSLYNQQTQTFGTMTNMLGIIAISLYKIGDEEQWNNTLINNENGTIRAENQYMKSIFGAEFINIMQTIKESRESLNPKQKEKIIESFKKSTEEFSKSRTFKIFEKDFHLK